MVAWRVMASATDAALWSSEDASPPIASRSAESCCASEPAARADCSAASVSRSVSAARAWRRLSSSARAPLAASAAAWISWRTLSTTEVASEAARAAGSSMSFARMCVFAASAAS